MPTNGVALRPELWFCLISAAAPAFADQAQDAARIKSLSFIEAPDLADIPADQVLQERSFQWAQDIALDNCTITMTQWFVWAGRDTFILRMVGDLRRDTFDLIHVSRDSVVALRSGPDQKISVEFRDAGQLFNGPDGPDRQDLTAAAKVYAALPVVTSESDFETLTYPSMPIDTVVELADSVQRYADDWCHLAG
jgi:hypothetical protein